MRQMELFLLLPVYLKADGYPGYLKRIDALGNDEYRSIIDAINRVKSFFCYENFQGYYDSQNVKGFMMPIDMLEDCYPKMSVLLRTAMVYWGTDWRRRKTIDERDEVRYLGETIKDETMCEVAKRQISNVDSRYLIVDCNAFDHKSDERKIEFNGRTLVLSTCAMGECDLFVWFSNTRKPARIFHLNPKHGENGKGAHPENKGDEVSVLLCSEKSASELLARAIGKDVECRTLYCYDAENESFIEFKCEGGNVYHGFHIRKDQVNGRVPNKVIKKIEFLRKRYPLLISCL